MGGAGSWIHAGAGAGAGLGLGCGLTYRGLQRCTGVSHSLVMGSNCAATGQRLGR